MSFIKDRYNLVARDDEQFIFVSSGKKGDFTLAGGFDLIDDPSKKRRAVSHNYNLGYGVLKKLPDGKFEIDDELQIGNGDEDRIFNTVAHEVSLFMRKDPLNVLSFSGSTPARTRKYRQQLSRHYSDITQWVDIYGYNPQTNVFEPFVPNSTINYQGFLIENKIS
jgi:hypothetical protein